MKHLPIAAKAITLLFTAAFLVACSGSDTKEAEEAAAKAAAAAEAARAAEQAAASAASTEERRMQEAAAAVGTVFYFEFDSSTLTPQAREALDAHITLLKTSDRTVRLEGHTMSAAPASTIWHWVSAEPMRFAITWRAVVWPTTA